MHNEIYRSDMPTKNAEVNILGLLVDSGMFIVPDGCIIHRFQDVVVISKDSNIIILYVLSRVMLTVQGVV